MAHLLRLWFCLKGHSQDLSQIPHLMGHNTVTENSHEAGLEYP